MCVTNRAKCIVSLINNHQPFRAMINYISKQTHTRKFLEMLTQLACWCITSRLQYFIYGIMDVSKEQLWSYSPFRLNNARTYTAITYRLPTYYTYPIWSTHIKRTMQSFSWLATIQCTHVLAVHHLFFMDFQCLLVRRALMCKGTFKTRSL